MWWALACVHPAAEPVDSAPVVADPPPAILWVTGWFSDELVSIDLATGAERSRLSIPGPQAIVPIDGGVRVVAEKVGEIWDVTETGAHVWASGFVNPTGLARLPTGGWAVGSYDEDRVVHVDDAGQIVGEIATGLDGADAGMAVDARGRLWVPCYDADAVVVLDGGREALRLDAPHARTVRIDAAGVAWVSASAANEVRRFDLDGQALPVFKAVPGPTGLAFDGDGLWIAGDRLAAVKRWDLATAAVTAELDPGVKGVTFLTRTP